jgi:DNA-binding protein H-NS
LEAAVAKRAINIKFDKMEVAELVQLRDEIETALNGKIVIEREELQTRMDALAALVGKRSNGDGRVAPRKGSKHGRGAQSAKAKVHPLKGKKAEPKYRGPDGETWAGRGLAPRWLTALEKKGKKREGFLIKA